MKANNYVCRSDSQKVAIANVRLAPPVDRSFVPVPGMEIEVRAVEGWS